MLSRNRPTLLNDRFLVSSWKVDNASVYKPLFAYWFAKLNKTCMRERKKELQVKSRIDLESLLYRMDYQERKVIIGVA